MGCVYVWGGCVCVRGGSGMSGGWGGEGCRAGQAPASEGCSTTCRSAFSSCPGPRRSGWSGWEGRQTWHEGETWAQEGTPFLILPSPRANAKGTLMKGVESHPPHGFQEVPPLPSVCLSPHPTSLKVQSPPVSPFSRSALTRLGVLAGSKGSKFIPRSSIN